MHAFALLDVLMKILNVYLKTAVCEAVLDINFQAFSVIILCHLYEHIEPAIAYLHRKGHFVCTVFGIA